MNTLIETYTKFAAARLDCNRMMICAVDELIESIKASAESVDPKSNIRIVQSKDVQLKSWDPRYHIPSEQAKAVLYGIRRGKTPAEKVFYIKEMLLRHSMRYPNGDRVALNPTTIELIETSELGRLVWYLTGVGREIKMLDNKDDLR